MSDVETGAIERADSYTAQLTHKTREALREMRAQRASPYVLGNPESVRRKMQQFVWTWIKSQSAQDGNKLPVVEWLTTLSKGTGIDFAILHEIVLSPKPLKGYPSAFVLTIFAHHFGTTVEKLMEHPKYGLQHKP